MLRRDLDYDLDFTMSTIDRSEASRSLAKAIAFKNCGKDAEAAWWARQLVLQLQCAEILTEEKEGE